jgi:ATP-dependent Clp protease ATP-binding subunit ClpA
LLLAVLINTEELEKGSLFLINRRRLRKMRMTDRLKRIIHLAEGERKETGCQFIQPEHLLSGCLLERTGAFAEMAQKCELDISGIRMAAAKKTEGKGSFRGGFPAQISEETKVVMEAAAGL